ncbi:MAG TPA: aminoglycoside phosphotransferase family protein [Actinomycetes bacterium]|nr:aminoglycoside phosphotransferase family protein [Actinomycetes bacterium]
MPNPSDSPSDAPTCDVVVLIPHPEDPGAFLCDATSNGSLLRLPSVTVEAEPSIESVIKRLDELLATRLVLLRANAVKWYDNYDTSAMVVETESPSSEPSPAFEWASVGATSDVAPEWAQPSVASWLGERRSGWSRLRPQWSRPGWVAEAGAWMRERMELAGLADAEIPQVHYVWGISMVLVADSRDGKAFLKCSGQRFQHEAAVTQALASHTPSHLPEVLAIEPDRGWLLMRDFDGEELGMRESSTWGVGLDVLGTLQRHWLRRSSELLDLGAEHRPLTALAKWVEQTAENGDLLSPMTADDRRRWLEVVPVMTDACLRLDAVGPGETLVHGDFHPYNVAIQSNGDAIVFDWSDTSVAHPALDVVTYVMRAHDFDVRKALFDRYFAGWDGAFGDQLDDDFVRLVLSVGAVHQAHTYTQILPTVMPEDLSNLEGGDVQWLRRAMAYADTGLATPVM